jgi:hypothetical protein
MNILLVTDGSSCSGVATQMLKELRLPAKTVVSILIVVPEPTFLGGITLDVIRGTRGMRENAQRGFYNGSWMLYWRIGIRSWLTSKW